MLFNLSSTKQPKTSFELLKILQEARNFKISDKNEKLNTILSEVNASQNSRHMTRNTHSSFHTLAIIITEKLDNIQKD